VGGGATLARDGRAVGAGSLAGAAVGGGGVCRDARGSAGAGADADPEDPAGLLLARAAAAAVGLAARAGGAVGGGGRAERAGVPLHHRGGGDAGAAGAGAPDAADRVPAGGLSGEVPRGEMGGLAAASAEGDQLVPEEAGEGGVGGVAATGFDDQVVGLVSVLLDLDQKESGSVRINVHQPSADLRRP